MRNDGFMKNSLTQYLPSGYKFVLLLGIFLSTATALGLVAAQQPLFALVGVALIPLVLAIVLIPDAPTLVVIAVMYSNAAVIAVQFHHVPLVIGAAVPGLLFIPLASYLIFHRQKFVATAALVPIIVFHLIQIFSALFSKDIGIAFQNWIDYLIEGLFLYFIITNVVRSLATLRRVVWVLLIVGGLIGALGFYQLMTETYNNNYGGFAQVSNAAFDTGETTLYGQVEQPRLAGTVGEVNRHAQTLLMLVPLGLFLLWGERSKVLRVIMALLTGFSLLSVAVTFSRGAAVGFVVMIVVMVFMRYIRLQQMIVVLLGILLLTVVLPQYTARIVNIQRIVGLVAESDTVTQDTKADGALQGRANEMMTALLVFSDYPLLGVGPHMFPYYYQEYSKDADFKRHQGADREAHNLYLGIAADNGIIGLLCFMAIFYVTLRDLVLARKRWVDSRPDLANMATGFILAIVVYLATGLGVHFSFIRFFWIIMALANSMIYIAGCEAKASTQRLESTARLTSEQGLALSLASTR